jgi:UDP-N-acetylglucosamine diphosphorylase/glucosamine-1-phosphate N-acetyltransferase
MQNVILFDSDIREQLLPLTFTRPVCELRVGILTIREKWEKWLNAKVSYITQDYLTDKYPINISEDNFVINGSVFPSEHLCRLIHQLEENEALLQDGELIAARLNEEQFEYLMQDEEIEELEGFEVEDTPFMKLTNLSDIFTLNGMAINEDFRLLTEGRESQQISDTNTVIGGEHIFMEEGANVEGAYLNASTGPIYIGRNAEIMEGAMIRGPLALCDHSLIKMGAKIYGATTIGPHSKTGGEISNSVITGYSNKSHEGYLGNSMHQDGRGFTVDGTAE